MMILVHLFFVFPHFGVLALSKVLWVFFTVSKKWQSSIPGQFPCYCELRVEECNTDYKNRFG